MEAPSGEIVGASTLSSLTRRFVFGNAGPGKGVFFFQRCHRPWDFRKSSLGINRSSRSSVHTQLQVLSKGFLSEPQHTLLLSRMVARLGLDPAHLRFARDDWKSTTIGAYGRGYEVLYRGVEICQLTLFDQYLFKRVPTVLEVTFGLERLALVLINEKRVRTTKVIAYRYFDREYFKLGSASRNECRQRQVGLLRMIKRWYTETLEDDELWRHVTDCIHEFNLVCLDPYMDGIVRLWWLRNLTGLVRKTAARYVLPG